MKFPRYETLLAKLEERLGEIKTARRARVDEHSAWENGFNDALDGEIEFITRLLNLIKAIEKPIQWRNAK